jgi:hypothetical protein
LFLPPRRAAGSCGALSQAFHFAAEFIPEPSARAVICPAMAAPGKIGILTFHRCINYGSYWQARCLAEGLRARGLDAALLDHDCREVSRREWRCSLQPTLPERTSPADIPSYKRKGRKFIEAFRQLPCSARFSLQDPGSVDGYDAIVVGSDEVWNFRHPWYGGKTIFFGSGLRAGRLVSYAASFGNHQAADGLAPDWAAMLRGFAAISVRDDNSRRLIRSAVGVEPELVLDPCLQFPEIVKADRDIPDEPYVLVYGFGFPAWLQNAVRRWSRRFGIRLLSVGYRNDWADEQLIGAGPLDFAALAAGARAVITNFFHGCVFALLNGKPFVSVPSAYRFNKVTDLAAALGAERHLVGEETPEGDYDALLGAPLDRGIGERIGALRRRSTAYLDAALA